MCEDIAPQYIDTEISVKYNAHGGVGGERRVEQDAKAI